MNILLFLIAVGLIFGAGYLCGTEYKMVIIHDSWEWPKDDRSENMSRQDAVMKLKNELANSGALYFKKNEDGTWMVMMKVRRLTKNFVK